MTDITMENIGPVDNKRLDEKHRIVDSNHDAFNNTELEGSKPTEEELHGPNALRRVSAPIPWAAYTVAFLDLFERFSYYGVNAVYRSFVNHHLPTGNLPGSHHNTGAGGGSPQAVSGALGKGAVTAQGVITFNNFWLYCVPLLGAWVADQYWGRYKTLCVSISIAMVGHIILIISSVPTVIVKTQAAEGVFLLGVIITGFGTGFFKPNISPLIAEQISVQSLFVKTTKKGERVIIDPTITQSRLYHYFYFFTNIGALVGQICMVYAEKYVGFWLSFLLPTLLFFVCPAIMFWGRHRYKQAPPQRSTVSKAFRILIYAQKGRWSINPVKTWKRMHEESFWNNVKPSNIAPSQRPKWMTFDDQWVDEVRRGFAACAVFLYFPLYWLVYNQVNNDLEVQAGIMETRGIPNDVLNNLDPFALIIIIPIFDALIFPALRRARIRVTPIRKISVGFFAITLSTIWVLILEVYVYRKSPCPHAYSCVDADGNPLPAAINVWLQVGSYVFLAISEILCVITTLEYAFSKAPRNMRSLVQAVALFMTSISAAIGEGMDRIAANPLLGWNYGLVAAISFFGGILFLIQFWSLDLEEDELNMLPEGHVIAPQDVDEPSEHVSSTTELKE